MLSNMVLVDHPQTNLLILYLLFGILVNQASVFACVSPPVDLFRWLISFNSCLPDMELKVWPSVKLFPTYVTSWGTPQVRYVILCVVCVIKVDIYFRIMTLYDIYQTFTFGSCVYWIWGSVAVSDEIPPMFRHKEASGFNTPPSGRMKLCTFRTVTILLLDPKIQT